MRQLSLSVLILILPIFLLAQNWLQINAQSSGIASDPFLPEVQSMLIDLQGREWYGSDGGLASYYKGRWIYFFQIRNQAGQLVKAGKLLVN